MDAPHQSFGFPVVTMLAMGWAGLVISAAFRHRPLPVARQVALGLRAGSGAALPPLRLSPRLAARVAVGVAATAVHPLLGVGLIALRALRPWVRRRRAATDRAAAIDLGVADAVALLALAVSAGHNLLGALDATARRTIGPVADELTQVVAAAGRGQRLADALDACADRLGDAVRPMTSALISCERYGAPVGVTLQRLGVDVRLASRQRAEAAARRVPVRLLFPLVTCILPAFGLLTVAPLIAGSLRGLGL